MVDITITEQGERQIVKISGELDNTASRDAVKALAPITEQENYDVEVDCSELKYISSSGLRLLLNIYKHQCTIGHPPPPNPLPHGRLHQKSARYGWIPYHL